MGPKSLQKIPSDNSKILAQADSGMVYAWDTANGQQLFTFTGAIGGSSFAHPPIVAWSPDGQICAISYPEPNDSTNLVLLGANGGKQLFQKQMPSANGIVWSPDSRYFAFPDAAQWSEGQSWSASIWETGTYQKIGSIGGQLPVDSYGNTSYSTALLTIAWSPDGQYLATLFGNTGNLSLFIHQFNKKKLFSAFAHITSYDIDANALSYASAWSPNEKYLAVCASNNLLVLNILSGREVMFDDKYYLSSSVKTFAWATDSQSINVVDAFDNTTSNWAVS